MSKRSVTVAAGDVEALERDAQGAIAAASTRAALDDARVQYLGRKSDLKQALRGIRDRESGMALNAVRERLEGAFDARGAGRGGGRGRGGARARAGGAGRRLPPPPPPPPPPPRRPPPPAHTADPRDRGH